MTPRICLQYSIIYSPKFVKCSSGGRHLSVSVSSSTQKTPKTPKSKMDTMHGFLVPDYTLHDFDDGEECKVVRMIFQMSGVPYQFKHVHKDDYILEDYPFYALPALEMNERKYGSVLSICRHLAWRYNLSGKTAYDDAQVDDIAEKVFEVRMKIKNWIDHIEHAAEHACDEECTEDGAEKLLTETLFPILERVLKAAPSSWLVGHSMTWADLLVACLVNPIIYQRPKLLQDFPLLYLHNEKIAHHDDLSGFLYHQRRSLSLDDESESANYLRSQWSACVKSTKMLKRVTVVMRGAERVDRIFGSTWCQTEKFMDKVYPTDINVPKGAVLHPHFYQFNPPITNMGKYTAQLITRALGNRGIEPAVIFCSPTLRTLQTAAAVAKSTGSRILVEPGLLEPMEWYRRAGAKQLPDFFEDVIDFQQIDKTYKPIYSMAEMNEQFSSKPQDSCIERIMLTIKNICVIYRDSPALIVGHAVTMDIASRIGQHGDSLSSENVEDLTSYEDSTYPSDPSGQAAKLEMGVRYPPLSVIGLTRSSDAPPYVVKTIPDLIPPLTYGAFSNKILH
ncbi:unnamed protein product [Caenorhabditis sp. 36 PRJEB53466]|nr:unnamed protein product [Caenorhabditis sp. 36 PRJEB53466]